MSGGNSAVKGVGAEADGEKNRGVTLAMSSYSLLTSCPPTLPPAIGGRCFKLLGGDGLRCIIVHLNSK